MLSIGASVAWGGQRANPSSTRATEATGYNVLLATPAATRASLYRWTVTTLRDWQRNRQMWIRVLENKTGETLAAWNQRINERRFRSERSLRSWLENRGITGYAQSLLVMERFGYPDFVVTPAEQLIELQYADRPQLKPIYNAIIDAVTPLGEFVIQARQTYVSLVTTRRTFARVQPTTKARVDLGLRLQRRKPGGRLRPSRIHPTMPLQISLSSADEVDHEVRERLREAYRENA